MGSWQPAQKIVIGNSILLFNGKRQAVTNIFFKDSTATVYNLKVSDYHTYYVSRLVVLVHNDCIAGTISKIAKKYGNFECKECAADIVKSLKKEGLNGEILDLRTPSSKWGNIWSDTQGGNISTNGFHRAVMVDGKVYDNIHTAGVSYDEWINDFHGVGGLSVTKTSF